MVNRVFVIGEILFDVYERDGRRPGGAPFNYACHMKGLGCDVSFASRIGDDPPGRELAGLIRDRGLPESTIQTDSAHPTGEVRIRLDENKTPDFTIAEDTAYDYIEYDDSIKDRLKGPSGGIDLIYFGTLCQRKPASRATIMEALEGAGDAVKFCDINLRRNCYSREIIESSLKKCSALKLNGDELKTVSGMFGLGNDLRTALRRLCESFEIRYICVTLGGEGSVLFDGNSFFEKKLSPQKITDSVGAGDMFAAVLSLGILNRADMKETLERSGSAALEICRIRGALPKNGGIYEKLLAGNNKKGAIEYA